MERSEKRQIVEALLLAAQEPLPAARIASVIPRATPKLVSELVAELDEEYRQQDRAFEVREVAGGFQLRTRSQFAEYLQQLQPDRPLRLSQAALETLSIVAYKQPVTRAEVERIRGVDVGAVLRSLVERKLVRIAGHREVPGRPMLYASTKRFLEVFGLAGLEDLPTLRDLQELAAAAMPEVAAPESPGQPASPQGARVEQDEGGPPQGKAAQRPRSEAQPSEGGPPQGRRPRPEFTDVIGWQPLILNRAKDCADCGASLRSGDRAFVGLTESGLSPHALCRDCADDRF